MLEHPRRRLGGSDIRRIVEELANCVEQLHGRLTAVLRLRAGVGRPHPLSVESVAERLGIRVDRVQPLEVLALRRLERAAQTTACAASSSEPAHSLFGVAFSSSPIAEGGVKSALYFLPAQRRAAGGRPPAASSQPLGVSRIKASGTLDYVFVLAALVGVLLVALLVADSQGLPVLPRRLSRRRRQGGSPHGGKRPR